MVTSKLPHWLIVGFTGHRSIKNEALITEKIQAVLAKQVNTIPYLAGFSSAASGADTLFLAALKAQAIPYQVVLPFTRDSFKADFTEAQWAITEPLIDHAFNEKVLPPMVERNEAYLETGVLTVDRCDLLVAVWDGKAAAGKGGTSEIVAYARQQDKPLIIIDSETGTVSQERLALLPHEKAAPENNAANRQTRFKTTVENAYTDFDKNATNFGPWARKIVVFIILLHLIASAVAIAGEMLDVFKGHAWISWFKVIALVGAFYLVYLHHRLQHHWVDTRPAAEVCRMFLAIWPLKRQDAALHEATIKRHHSLVRDLMISWQVDKQAALPFDDAKSEYLRNRVEGQLDYYRSKLKPAKLWHHWFRQFASVFTIMAIVAGALSLINKYTHFLDNYNDIYHSLKFLSIVLPLATTAILSSLLVIDYGRRVRRYDEMIHALETARHQITLAPSWTSLWRAVNELEQILLNEVEEWQSLTIFTGDSH